MVNISTSNSTDYGIWWVFSRGWIDIGVFIYKLEISFHWRAKDWMSFKGIEVIGKNRYKVFEKNIRYENVKIYSGFFPKIKG